MTPPDAHPATRARLLDAGARLMARHGYAGTTVRELATEAGLTTGAIYAQFPGGKEELFRAILTAVGERVQAFVADALIGADDPVDLMVRQAGALWDFFAAHPSYAALVVRENVAGALGDPSPFVAQNAESIRQLRALFDQAIAEGLMAPVNVSYVLFWVVSATMNFHGCGPLRETLWRTADLASARADFLASLRRTLTPG
ncbi:MAG TPA: TetR/AcrR family transcriptional regulator [Myxococcota bacterium]|nr:TetR/AcrR family transcriptional regulator [Myxococcota bacterium]